MGDNVMFGKRWKTEATFASYEEADAKRAKILSNTGEKVQVKVKRLASGMFHVKTRVLPEVSPTKTDVLPVPLDPKKNRKERKRKNRERRERKNSKVLPGS